MIVPNTDHHHHHHHHHHHDHNDDHHHHHHHHHHYHHHHHHHHPIVFRFATLLRWCLMDPLAYTEYQRPYLPPLLVPSTGYILLHGGDCVPSGQSLCSL